MMDDRKHFSMTPDQWRALGKSGDAHKYDYGHALVVSGPAGQGGAARLAARGALRMGAGLVSIACTDEARAEHAAQLNAVMVRTCADGVGFETLLKTLKPNAICVGPNLGLGPDSAQRLSQVLSYGGAICIDADAITLLSRDNDIFPVRPHAQCVLTPHVGELRRFVPDICAATTDRTVWAQHAADKAGCTVLLKGADTIVAAPDRAPMVISSQQFKHTSWLATAGSGDVLAGFITGLLARGFDGFDAATCGAELHFRCAEQIGPGLISEDIPEALPKVLR